MFKGKLNFCVYGLGYVWRNSYMYNYLSFVIILIILLYIITTYYFILPVFLYILDPSS